MGRTGHARAPRAAVRRLAAAALCLAAGCGRSEDTLDTVRRLPLADPAAAGATLAVDSAGVLWIGAPGRLLALDSAGAPGAAVRVGGDTVPRLLWRAGDRLVIALPGRLALAPADGGAPAAGWATPHPEASARDPRGRWIYAATAAGGVVGLDAATLEPRWGWPDAGAPPAGAAVSPLADRVYVATDTAAGQRARLLVRDAASGRVLSTGEQGAVVRGLAAARNGALFGTAGGFALRFAHEGDRLEAAWSQAAGADGGDGWLELRADPAGARVAVFGRGEGARLVLLDARTGDVLGATTTAPLDAAFGPEGRLYLLEERAVRIVR